VPPGALYLFIRLAEFSILDVKIFRMKKLALSGVALLYCLQVFAQHSDAKANVIAEAKKMGQALVNKDYTAFTKTTYPAAIAHTEGGMAKIISDLDGQIKAMNAEGTTIAAAWPGEPSKMIDTAGELQCTIPQNMTMKMKSPEGKLVTQTTLIALSPDKGKTWYFIDTADRTLEKMREMFPNISSRLVVHKSPEPKFISDKND
jgi:hypothetical protein